jgi:hypothetical protein
MAGGHRWRFWAASSEFVDTIRQKPVTITAMAIAMRQITVAVEQQTKGHGDDPD